MWLFDDLLKKPTVDNSAHDDSTGSTGSNPPTDDGSTGSNPPSDPFVQSANSLEIQKTEEISIITESPAETAAAMPSPVTVNAVEDTSSIIIWTTTPAPSVQDESPISVIPDESHLFQNVELSTPSVTAPSEPLVQDIGILDLRDESSTPAEIPSVSVIEEDDSLMDILSEDTASVPSDVEVVQGISDVAPVSEIVPSPTETPVTADVITRSLDVDTSNAIISQLIENTDSIVGTPTVELYEHPADFIEASIERIDAMIERIDEIYDAKMTEALGYKSEKEKYTNLEQQAYLDAQKYVQEKKHALAMRLYFVEQGKIDEKTVSTNAIASVETTLTGLAVQNAVSETVKSEKKKPKKEKAEMIV